MTCTTAITTIEDTAAAVAELKGQLGDGEGSLILAFSSSRHDPARVAAELAAQFPESLVAGCTTSGELVSGRMLSNGIAAMRLPREVVGEVQAAWVERMDDPASVEAALTQLADAHGETPSSLDPRSCVGVVIHDGMSGLEEVVMERIGDLTNVPFVGGSAGDDARFEATHLFLDGVVRSSASLLLLLSPPRPYHILKTQSFEVLEPVLRVTAADEASRTVKAFNGKPATIAYAEAIGVPVEELPQHFMAHPVGLVMSDGSPYVRSPQRTAGTDVVFYCQIKEGMELRLLRARDIVADTRRDLEAALAELGSCAGVVNFHCILRTLELEAKGQCDAYGALFTAVPTVGFSTYGESYIGHINQTSTMLMFS